MDRQILQILITAGQRGISVRALVKHLYNMNVTFFHQPDLEEIHAYAYKYLRRNSKSDASLIERTGRRGFYRLNTRNADVRQLMLDFLPRKEEDEQQEATEQHEDLSLSLF